MPYRSYLPLVFILLLTQPLVAQVNLTYNFNTELAEDSTTAHELANSLTTFITELQGNQFTWNYVDSNHVNTFSFFFDALYGIGKSSRESVVFHDPLVLKSYPIANESYLITVAFSGDMNNAPFIYKIVEFKAVPYLDHYRFYCPFKENTAHFNSTQLDEVTYYYTDTLDMAKAHSFLKFKHALSHQLDQPNLPLAYYKFTGLDQLLKSYGMVYDAGKCNFLCYDLGFSDNHGQLYLTGTDNENYRFGYLGDYLYHQLPNGDSLYAPFVNGMSAYYGGYALSGDDMDELKSQFRNELKNRPDINFYEEFKKGRKSSVNRHFSYYVMSAFLYEYALKKIGFDRAIQLAYSGWKGEVFFEKLDALLAINETNFHATIVQLIR